MKKNIIYSLLLVVAVLFAGCEDRLDIAKHGNMGGQDDFYKTNEQTEQAVAAMYSRVKGLYYTWFFTKNMLSDDAWCGGGSRGDNNSYEQLMNIPSILATAMSRVCSRGSMVSSISQTSS